MHYAGQETAIKVLTWMFSCDIDMGLVTMVFAVFDLLGEGFFRRVNEVDRMDTGEDFSDN